MGSKMNLYQALWWKIDELSGRMADLMAKMTALCDGLRRERYL